MRLNSLLIAIACGKRIPMDHTNWSLVPWTVYEFSARYTTTWDWGFYATRAAILQRFWWPHIQPDMPHLPSTTDDSSPNPSYSCDSSPSIFQNLYRHNAYARIARFQIHCPRSLFSMHLARISNVKKWKCNFNCKLGLPRHHLSLGSSQRNCNR